MTDTRKRILVGAHRGAMCHAPENTLSAFETAIEMGAWRIEFDVRRSGDGHLVVVHDATLNRTTNGNGPVAEHTLEELKQVKALGPNGTTDVIPTLREVLETVRQRSRLLVEIKDAGIAREVVQQIAEEGMLEQCTISSFHEEELETVKVCTPRIPTAYFLMEPKPFDAQSVIDRLGVGLLVVSPRAATAAIIADAKRNGLHVRCGFRDDLTYDETFALFRRLADWGVDEMASGRPDWMGQMAEAYAALP